MATKRKTTKRSTKKLSKTVSRTLFTRTVNMLTRQRDEKNATMLQLAYALRAANRKLADAGSDKITATTAEEAHEQFTEILNAFASNSSDRGESIEDWIKTLNTFGGEIADMIAASEGDLARQRQDEAGEPRASDDASEAVDEH